MSEAEESLEITPEDERILELMDRMAALDEVTDESGGDPAAAAERRELVEALALLPLALPSRAPSADLEGRILAAVAADPAGRGEKRSPAPGRPRWALPLAAGLAGLLFAVAAWQQQSLEEQRRTIAELRAGLHVAVERGDRLAALESEIVAQRAKLAMMTRPGTEFCLLKPVGSEPMWPAASATMVVASDRASWYLRADGLGPCPLGRTYKIWFMVDGRTVAGPTFRVKQLGEEIEISSEELPSGLEGIKITLEFEPETPVPTGPEILYADQAMRLL